MTFSYSNPAPKKIEDVENFCDKLELQRINAECVQASFASKRPPSFFPGYEAEEIDDGRLDPIVETGFVRADEIPDFHEEDGIDEAEDLDDEPVVLTSAPEPTPPAGPKAPRSNVDYRKKALDSLIENQSKGRLRGQPWIFVLKRGQGLVPYSTGMLSR